MHGNPHHIPILEQIIYFQNQIWRTPQYASLARFGSTPVLQGGRSLATVSSLLILFSLSVCIASRSSWKERWLNVARQLVTSRLLAPNGYILTEKIGLETAKSLWHLDQQQRPCTLFVLSVLTFTLQRREKRRLLSLLFRLASRGQRIPQTEQDGVYFSKLPHASIGRDSFSGIFLFIDPSGLATAHVSPWNLLGVEVGGYSLYPFWKESSQSTSHTLFQLLFIMS